MKTIKCHRCEYVGRALIIDDTVRCPRCRCFIRLAPEEIVWQTVLDFGQFKGKSLEQAPAWYLLSLSNSEWTQENRPALYDFLNDKETQDLLFLMREQEREEERGA